MSHTHFCQARSDGEMEDRNQGSCTTTWQPVGMVALDIRFDRKFCFRALRFLQTHYVGVFLWYVLISIFLKNKRGKNICRSSQINGSVNTLLFPPQLDQMCQKLIDTLAQARRPATFHEAILKFHDAPVESFASLAKPFSDEPVAAFLDCRSPEPPS